MTEIEEVYTYNDKRECLFGGLLKGSKDLLVAGCKCLYLDGSFVTSKDEPRDFDACWEQDGVELDMLAQELQVFTPPRLRQKAIYRGEFLPSKFRERGRTYDMVDFFQQVVDSNHRKGIIRIDIRCDKRLKE